MKIIPYSFFLQWWGYCDKFRHHRSACKYFSRIKNRSRSRLEAAAFNGITTVFRTILPELVSSPWLKIHQSINAASITHTLYLCSFDEKKTLFLGPWEPRLLAVKNYSCHFRYLYYLRILCIKIKLFAISLTSDNKGVVLLLFRRSLQTRTNLEWLFVVINITYRTRAIISRGLFFYPIFHYRLYCRAAYI